VTLLRTIPLLLALLAPACGDAGPNDEGPLSPYAKRTLAPWTGDLAGMRERRMIRVLVTYDKTNFFLVGGRPHGFEYELLRGFEDELNQGLGPGEVATQVVFLPVPFERLLSALVEGRGDVAAAGLTITPEREERVAFTAPYLDDVREVVVTAADAGELARLEDLAGRTVLVPRATSYVTHLRALSRELEEKGLAPIEVVEAEEGLQSEDLLEMVNAGAAPLTVVDDHIARLWAQLLEDVVVREDLVVHGGSRIAWAVRKESPELREALSRYAHANRRGTLLGNVLFRRYHEDDQWIRNPLAEKDAERLRELEALFRKYAERYDFDWLMIAALAYQESGLDHSKRSRRGAVGLMQLLPSTAADPNVGIADIADREKNVHAGVKYLAFLRDHYFRDDSIPAPARIDFALAAYNAGPRKVARFRARARAMGLDPNRWFRNVELAALQLVGRETVRYVSRINKYYLAYRLARTTRGPRELALRAR
jgi:membrane-bound lytic murein transglycosylase MltF